MKKFLLNICLCFCSIVCYGQYNMDLQHVHAPELKYLHLGNPGLQGKEIKVNNLYMEIGGKPVLPVMGEFHYSRMDERYWKDALMKMKASGVNIIATYCLWYLHEEQEGELSWTGRLNLRKFVLLCKELGLMVHLRIGPYCNAEIRYGALPEWLIKNKKIKVRTNDPLYLSYVRRWYQAIYQQIGDLLYKDDGPIMGIQLENEYVTKGEVIPHLMALKKIAVETGFDVPVYSMTHWMSTEFPKGEIIPYAGYYIETPWTADGKKELPVSDFEYYTYNRISNNIGTDIIKLDGAVESLSGKNNDSPYFTCEVGVGTETFYGRRPVVPAKMAGENINLRLGSGVNLMGYYMYVGGSNPVGKTNTFQNQTARISYDYQAPIREFGTLGNVMPETKKYNYFMNDFGGELATAIAYMPTSNQNTNNLQWAVRYNGKGGYLFCTNYHYKHKCRDYKGVQFRIKTENGELRIPDKKITIHDGTYFFWPFQQRYGKVSLKYATVQPICKMNDHGVLTYFFFENDQIEGQYVIDNNDISRIETQNAEYSKKGNQYVVNHLIPGSECQILITHKDGSQTRFVTLTSQQSDKIWKCCVGGRDYVILTNSILAEDNEHIALIASQPLDVWEEFDHGKFIRHEVNKDRHNIKADFKSIRPMDHALWIKPQTGNFVVRHFVLNKLAKVDRAYIRYRTSSNVKFGINGQIGVVKNMGEYKISDVTSLIKMGDNELRFELDSPQDGVLAEVEVLMKNGERILWDTDGTWLSDDGRPAQVFTGDVYPTSYAPEERLAVYQIMTNIPVQGSEEARLYIKYKGNIADAFLDGQLVGDNLYNGLDWILSISRMSRDIDRVPLTIRIRGFNDQDNIYLEKGLSEKEAYIPVVESVQALQDYKFIIK